MRNALAMRAVLEAIVTHPEGVDAGTLAEIRRYTKLFWLNSGPYNHLTARKFVLSMHARGVAAAAATGRDEGGRDHSRPRRGETLDAMLGRLRPMFFDPAFEPMVTNKTPGPGKDILDRQRQQPLRRRDDGGPRRASTSSIRSTRAW